MFHIGFFCGVFACATAANPDKTTISVYYNTLDYESRKFLLTQLFPVISSSLEQHINIELIPYGKTIEDVESSTFYCPNGESECYLNKIEACIAHYIPDKKGLNLIKCLTKKLKRTSTVDDVKERTVYCESRNNLNHILANCADEPENTPKLMRNLANMTSSVLEYSENLPVVVLNNKFNETVDSLAKKDLKGLICSIHNIEARNCIVKQPEMLIDETEPNGTSTTEKNTTPVNTGAVSRYFSSVILFLLAILTIS